jgi:NADH-quinone oxidoreductase subunit M
MCMALFSENVSGVQGAMVQMFNHGINIIGLWVMVDILEKRFGTRKMSELGGLAKQYPVMAIFFLIIALANIALPLTNAFPGEFLMFNGVLNAHTSSLYAILFTVFAGMGIILGAVYTLNMVRKIFFGEVNSLHNGRPDLKLHEQIGLGVIVVMILITGFFPQLLLNITEHFSDTVTAVFIKAKQ